MVTLSDKAVKEIKKVMEDLPEATNRFLRVGVAGGGCSGFEYSLTVGHEYDNKKDTISNQHGVDVVVDKKSALYLDGTTLDYYSDISKRGFKFDNSNAVKSCGCGRSFQV